MVTTLGGEYLTFTKPNSGELISKQYWSIQFFQKSNQYQRRIDGGSPPTAQHFLDFMQFWGKFDKIICWRPS